MKARTGGGGGGTRVGLRDGLFGRSLRVKAVLPRVEVDS